MYFIFPFIYNIQKDKKYYFIILKLENQSENEYIILKVAAERQVGTYPKKEEAEDER